MHKVDQGCSGRQRDYKSIYLNEEKNVNIHIDFFQDQSKKRAVRNELINTVVDHLIKVHGGVACPSKNFCLIGCFPLLTFFLVKS